MAKAKSKYSPIVRSLDKLQASSGQGFLIFKDPAALARIGVEPDDLDKEILMEVQAIHLETMYSLRQRLEACLLINGSFI